MLNQHFVMLISDLFGTCRTSSGVALTPGPTELAGLGVEATLGCSTLPNGNFHHWPLVLKISIEIIHCYLYNI